PGPFEGGRGRITRCRITRIAAPLRVAARVGPRVGVGVGLGIWHGRSGRVMALDSLHPSSAPPASRRGAQPEETTRMATGEETRYPGPLKLGERDTVLRLDTLESTPWQDEGLLPGNAYRELAVGAATAGRVGLR